MASDELDAVILAGSPEVRERVLGLTLVERGLRVAAKLGARRIVVVGSAAEAAALVRWREPRRDAALLVVRAGDQVVHTPLVEPLLASTGAADRRIAVDADGAYAGALWARGAAVDEVIAALAADLDGDRALAARWREAGPATPADAIRHGDIARHAAASRSERAGATAMLLRLIVKSEDGPVTRYVYRPLSRPLTRLLLHTPVTPNQVSIVVGLLGLLGCWLTAQRGQAHLVAGAALILFAGILDGCDGEIARLRLVSSRLGAWLDTVIDELTTTFYFVAIGYHTYLHRPDSWVLPSVAIGAVGYAASIYCIYYFLIVVSKTGNSQHYVGSLEIVEDPDDGAALRPRPPRAATTPRWLRVIGAMLLQGVRRDFINLVAVALALANAYLVIYLAMLIGGVIASCIVTIEHLRLRGQLRELARRGATPRLR